MPKLKKQGAHLAAARSRRSSQPTDSQAATSLTLRLSSASPAMPSAAMPSASVLPDQPMTSGSDSDSDFDLKRS